MPISPRFSDDLDVKYILVKTNYNDRVLLDNKRCKKMLETLDEFSGNYLDDNINEELLQEEIDDIKSIKREKMLRNANSIYFIPWSYGIKLLYTNDNGVTYPNDRLKIKSNVKSIRKLLKEDNIDDNGCFVFELLASLKLKFRNIMFGLTHIVCQR